MRAVGLCGVYHHLFEVPYLSSGVALQLDVSFRRFCNLGNIWFTQNDHTLEIFGNLQPDFLQFVLLCTEGTVEKRRAVLGVGVSLWIMVRSNRGLWRQVGKNEIGIEMWSPGNTTVPFIIIWGPPDVSETSL